MGSGNPVKKFISTASDMLTEPILAPIREGARAIGADGIVDATQGIKDFTHQLGNTAVDLATGEAAKQKKKADAANAQAAASAQATAATTAKQQATAAQDAIEQDRMASGSKSRTLLTGPAGLEDDDETSISRRTLMGAR